MLDTRRLEKLKSDLKEIQLLQEQTYRHIEIIEQEIKNEELSLWRQQYPHKDLEFTFTLEQYIPLELTWYGFKCINNHYQPILFAWKHLVSHVADLHKYYGVARIVPIESLNLGTTLKILQTLKGIKNNDQYSKS